MYNYMSWRGRTNPSQKHQLQERVDNFGVRALILPVVHPELNPIEMVWSLLKRKCAQRNMNFELSEVERTAQEVLENFSAECFASYDSHVQEVEQTYWDHIQEMDDL